MCGREREKAALRAWERRVGDRTLRFAFGVVHLYPSLMLLISPHFVVY